ncbi:MAG: hypothetical protein ACYTFE_05220 [Planctomycetota bacterium]|jgi:hypothetical protein
MRSTVIVSIFLLAVLPAVYGNANVQNWKAYAKSENKDTEYYYDMASLKYLTRFTAIVLDKAVYVTPESKKHVEAGKTVEYSLRFLRIECVNKKTDISLIVHFGTKEEIISSYDFSTEDFPPDIKTVNISALGELICPPK